MYTKSIASNINESLTKRAPPPPPPRVPVRIQPPVLANGITALHDLPDAGKDPSDVYSDNDGADGEPKGSQDTPKDTPAPTPAPSATSSIPRWLLDFANSEGNPWQKGKFRSFAIKIDAIMNTVDNNVPNVLSNDDKGLGEYIWARCRPFNFISSCPPIPAEMEGKVNMYRFDWPTWESNWLRLINNACGKIEQTIAGSQDQYDAANLCAAWLETAYWSWNTWAHQELQKQMEMHPATTQAASIPSTMTNTSRVAAKTDSPTVISTSSSKAMAPSPVPGLITENMKWPVLVHLLAVGLPLAL
jgi:hypothetical protein